MEPKIQPPFLSLLVMTSLFWHLRISVGDPTANAYDRACFVPPTQRTSNEDRLVIFETSSSFQGFPNFDLFQDYRAFPEGTCGMVLYFYTTLVYFDLEYGNTIEDQVNNVFKNHCLRKEDNNLNVSSHPWNAKVFATGTGILPEVSADELTRVPSHWLDGLVIRTVTDYIVAPGQINLCNVSFFHKVNGSPYNFNYTVTINGCPAGKYGWRCAQSCSCLEGVECHSFNGVCMCPKGLQGTRCDQRDPQLVVDKKEIYIPYGSSFTLRCTAHGMSPTRVSWTKDGDQTDTLVTNFKLEMAPYVPRPVLANTTVYAHDTSVNGAYTCEAQEDEGELYNQQVYVTVIAIPDPFLQAPQDCNALAHTNVTFTCETKLDAGVIRWVRGRSGNVSAVIKDGVGRYTIRQPNEGASQLHIAGVEFEDEDVYRCYVGFIFRAPDLSFDEASLVVNSAPPPECYFQDIIQVRSGTTLTLHCSVKGAKPIPKLTWAIHERDVTPQPVIANQVIQSHDGWSWNVTSTMTFVPAPEDDGKEIVFTLQTPALADSLEVKAVLNVTYAPIVTISPDPITLKAGENARIWCEATANPQPLYYKWTLQHHKKSHFRMRHTKDNDEFYIIKNVGTEYDKANLTCQVANDVGVTQMTVSIKVVDDSLSTAAVVTISVIGGLCLVLLLVGSFLAHRYRKKIRILWAKRAGGKYNAGKEYDVFISHKSNSPEEEFVMRDLIPRLEEGGYNVCVHYKSFLPGKSIIDNIADAVHLSRKTILILSPGFIESEWCRYEFQAALSEMLHLKADLIPIIFQDLGPMEKLSQDLKSILQTVSYITWPGGDGLKHVEQQERFWKLLWNALPQTPLEQKIVGKDEECVSSVSLGMSKSIVADEENVYE